MSSDFLSIFLYFSFSSLKMVLYKTVQQIQTILSHQQSLAPWRCTCFNSRWPSVAVSVPFGLTGVSRTTILTSESLAVLGENNFTRVQDIAP